MIHDRKAILKIIENADDDLQKLVETIGDYVEKARAETFGWCIAEACVKVDRGQDIRTYVIDKMFENMKNDFINFERNLKKLNEEDIETITYHMWKGFKE